MLLLDIGATPLPSLPPLPPPPPPKKDNKKQRNQGLKNILEMFIKLRARQSSDCAAPSELNRSTNAKNCSQINGSHSFSVSSDSGAIFILL